MKDDIRTMTTHAVLYVDDEEKALKYFRRAVSDQALAVHTAASVAEALTVLEAHGSEIGVLITDQRMPGQTGVDLLRRVREDWPDIIRLLTTAYSDLDEAIEAVNRGEIFRYITKPWDIRQLRAELAQALEIHRLRLERSLLLQEKLSVWQRLVEVNRIRDLVIMAGSFTHIRNAMAATAAYLEANVTESSQGTLVAPEQLDLWSLTEAEIRRTLELVDALIQATRGARGAFDARITPRRLVEDAAPAEHAVRVQEVNGVQPILIDSALASALIASLCRMSAAGEGAGVEVLCEPGALYGTGAAAVMTFRPTNSQALEETSGLDTNPEHLSAYLIAFHHGGSLQRVTEGSGRKGFRLTLPTDPATVPEWRPTEGWLESLLSRLESWT